MKKYKIFKNGKLILVDRFHSIEHIKKFLKKKCEPGQYEIQELSVHKDNDVEVVNIKSDK